MLPTFVVIGAMKAGTVSLRRHLDEHPEIFLARGGTWGEPNFFIDEHNWGRGLAWYQSLFAGGDAFAVRGECSPSYSMTHVYAGVPQRMADLVPDFRLVYLVRDPVERMRSMYMHQVSAGRERRRIAEALADPHYLGPSRYGLHIEEYLAAFDREQLLVVGSERFRADPAEALSRVWTHLGLAAPERVVPDHREHVSQEKRLSRLHGHLLRVRRPFKEDVAPRSRPDQRRGVAAALTTRAFRPADVEVPPELRHTLWDRLAADVEAVRAFVGDAEFASWRWGRQ